MPKGMSMPAMPKPRSSVRISGPGAKKAMQGMGVGKRGRFVLGGKVRSLSSNEYDDVIEMDMDECEHCDDMPSSLTKALKAKRARGMGGRFV